MLRLIGIFGFLFLVSAAFAADSLVCLNRQIDIVLKIPEKGKAVLQVNDVSVSVAKENWIVSMKPDPALPKLAVIVPEELSLSVELPKLPKKEYRFENLRHCGEDLEDTRVRIYETGPESKIFLEEIRCSCKRS